MSALLGGMFLKNTSEVSLVIYKQEAGWEPGSESDSLFMVKAGQWSVCSETGVNRSEHGGAGQAFSVARNSTLRLFSGKKTQNRQALRE